MTLYKFNFLKMLIILYASIGIVQAVPFDIAHDSMLICDIQPSHTHRPNHLVLKPGINNDYNNSSQALQWMKLRDKIWISYDSNKRIFHTNFGDVENSEAIRNDGTFVEFEIENVSGNEIQTTRLKLLRGIIDPNAIIGVANIKETQKRGLIKYIDKNGRVKPNVFSFQYNPERDIWKVRGLLFTRGWKLDGTPVFDGPVLTVDTAKVFDPSVGRLAIQGATVIPMPVECRVRKKPATGEETAKQDSETKTSE